MQILHPTHLVLKMITTLNSYSTETRICILNLVIVLQKYIL